MKNILNIYKPVDWTSNDVVQKVKKLIKANKVGHAGTLDPNADGVLVLGINEATKQLNQLLLDNKQYLATIQFNTATDTYDVTGTIIQTDNTIIKLEDIKKALEEFKTNQYYQTPPAYSAIKINGLKAYDLARKKIDVKLESRLVKLLDYEIVSYDQINQQLVILIDVSKGFYVRSLAVDLASKLNSCAHLAKLTRTRSGNFDIKDSIKIEQVYDFWTQQNQSKIN
ncbi:pseudouridine synthase [Ureaplasma diversum]|uniref:tRNA pseudouridine synthase B n=1 Tax=Ureaplasma diversum TaxID=42094 RepID=A0A0C5RKP3_9BACT|nr:tRNA pseudouridine(55) synthase TruB [Ureaplasma diversum]AJQ45223.1 pseudouridine synthase [Ureaplasma diversum]